MDAWVACWDSTFWCSLLRSVELAFDEQISMGSMFKFNEIILAIEKMQSIPVRFVSPMVRQTVRLPETLSLPVRAECASMVR